MFSICDSFLVGVGYILYVSISLYRVSQIFITLCFVYTCLEVLQLIKIIYLKEYFLQYRVEADPFISYEELLYDPTDIVPAA